MKNNKKNYSQGLSLMKTPEYREFLLEKLEELNFSEKLKIFLKHEIQKSMPYDPLKQDTSLYNVMFYIKLFKIFDSKSSNECGLWLSRLADSYHSGRGVEKNIDIAFLLYQASSNKGEPQGSLSLARCYEYGHGIPINKEKAYELYKNLSEKRYPQAILELSRLYREGIYVEKSESVALRLFELATKEETLSFYDLATIYFDLGDYENALILYENSLELGYKYAILGIANCYSHKNEPKEKQKAFKLYLQAYHNNNRLAASLLVDCYEQGLGIEKNITQAISILENEWKLFSCPFAMTRLGEYYLYGKGVKKDTKKAVALFLESAKKNQGKAFQNLALCYIYGFGVEKSLGKALCLYLAALPVSNCFEITKIIFDHTKLLKISSSQLLEEINQIEKLCGSIAILDDLKNVLGEDVEENWSQIYTELVPFFINKYHGIDDKTLHFMLKENL